MGGVVKRKKAGRPPGALGASTIHLDELVRRLDCHPLEILLRFAKNDAAGLGYDSSKTLVPTPKGDLIERDVITVEMRIKAAAEAAAYLFPKLKAIEHSGEVKNVHVEEKLTAIEVKSILANDPFLNQKQVEHGAIREPRAESAVPGDRSIEGGTSKTPSKAGSD
jgi:hypothetical protein